MSYTLEQIDQLTKKSVQRERSLVAEYKRTHPVPSRGIISTPEIDAEPNRSVYMASIAN